MRFLGIEPKVFGVSAPYFILALYLNSRLSNHFFRFPGFGIFLFIVGLLLWSLCYAQISRAYSMGKLLKEGCYSRIRHPIYAIWGFLIIPGFSLVIGGFMLLLPFVYWLAVLLFIGEEENALKERFGDEWRRYAKRTGRFLPRF